MDFNWNDFLDLANEWVSELANEQNSGALTKHYPIARYRSVASRAYYAIYHHAFALAETIGLESTVSASDHYHLRKFYENRGRVAQQLSAYLRDLYSLRRDADYDRNAHAFSPTKAQASALRSIEIARKAAEIIEHLRAKVK